MYGTMTLRPVGDLDVLQADQLRCEWYRLLDEEQPDLVIVDLSDVTFLDSAGLRLISGLVCRQRSRDASVAVSNASANVLHLLRVTSLSDLLDSLELVSDA
ncbi:MAG TPA: STAS domain-containing protein [Kineosporiaceae bacterium]|nr:STAS domain-containing protein [Kineosporiaceae bacterium]